MAETNQLSGRGLMPVQHVHWHKKINIKYSMHQYSILMHILGNWLITAIRVLSVTNEPDMIGQEVIKCESLTQKISHFISSF